MMELQKNQNICIYMYGNTVCDAFNLKQPLNTRSFIVLQLQVIWLGLQAFSKWMENSNSTFMSDNTSVVAYLRSQMYHMYTYISHPDT